MKTIKFLADSIQLMKDNGTPAQITVGTFIISSKGSLHFWAGKTGTFDRYTISFQIQFRPDHIQRLIDLGVRIDFDSVLMADLSPTAKRFKAGREAIKQGRYAPYYYMGDPSKGQTGVVENWLTANATCDISTLIQLDNVCRDNHLHHVAIHNDYVTGWGKKRIELPQPKPSSFYKAVRKNIANKKKKEADLLPVERLALLTK